MAKLTKKLKTIEKRRSRRLTVQKKKEHRQRLMNDAKAFTRQQNATLMKAERDTDFEELGEAAGNALEIIQSSNDGLVLETDTQKQKQKNLTRKQLKRKNKNIEKGLAVQAQLERKLQDKKRRIKIRAQIRNSDLHE